MIMVLASDAKDVQGQIFNVGSDAQNYQILEVAKMFKDDIKFVKGREGERFESFISLKKTYKIGWKPRIKLKNYIRNFKENL